MMQNKLSVIQTDDGSTSVYDLQFGENFHSTYGAIEESNHVYIVNGLKLFQKDELRILEVGFGTGLNCLLTIINKETNQRIYYNSIEKFPLSKEHIAKLNYSDKLKVSDKIFEKISNAEWDKQCEISDNFYLKKIKIDLLDFIPVDFYDIIYFDAFSPNAQPELWTTEIFKKLFYNLKQNGILTTYSSKGDVKRALRCAGFEVFRIDGPKGKRHILRALKK